VQRRIDSADGQPGHRFENAFGKSFRWNAAIFFSAVRRSPSEFGENHWPGLMIRSASERTCARYGTGRYLRAPKIDEARCLSGSANRRLVRISSRPVLVGPLHQLGKSPTQFRFLRFDFAGHDFAGRAVEG